MTSSFYNHQSHHWDSCTDANADASDDDGQDMNAWGRYQMSQQET